MHEMSDKKDLHRVLFMQSQTYYGADSRIHGLLMQTLDRSKVEVFTALNYGNKYHKSPAAIEIEKIPNVHIRKTNFGTTTFEKQRSEILKDSFQQGVPALISLGSLPAYVRKNKIDVIHCTEKPRDAYFGYLVSRASGAKCLIHLHVKAENWISPRVQWAMRNADGLVGVSQFVADSIIEMGFPPEKTFYVHNHVDLRLWDPGRDGSQVRHEFQIDPDIPILLIVSRLFSWKGHSELIQALAKVKQKGYDFKLLVVGEDDPRAQPGGGSYSEELKSQVNSLGLKDHVIFTGYRTDIPEIMGACDIYTMPSFEEPFGMVYLEAMGMQKPVIALDNGGSREIVKHGVTGLLSNPKDINQLAQNIYALIANPSLRVEMGVAGRKRVEDCFSGNKMAADMLKVYEKIATN
jgi:glycosyltransferase involved in cell wall biosynthesis